MPEDRSNHEEDVLWVHLYIYDEFNLTYCFVRNVLCVPTSDELKDYWRWNVYAETRLIEMRATKSRDGSKVEKLFYSVMARNRGEIFHKQRWSVFITFYGQMKTFVLK